MDNRHSLTDSDHELLQPLPDCTNCSFPHRKENYYKVLERYEDIVKLIGYIDESFTNGQIDILKK